MFPMISNQHYAHRANQKLCSWANAVFQNRGVCGPAVPSFPSPSSVIPFFFCSFPSFLDEPREETLATQATIFVSTTKTTQPCPQVFSINGALTCANAAFLTSFRR